MNKEPTPLEALKRIRQETIPATYNQDFDKEECCKIIETALKRLDMYENIVGIERIQDTNKKLKALEIIKRLVNKSGTENWIYETENDYVFADFRISKEEYDLLKEILL